MTQLGIVGHPCNLSIWVAEGGQCGVLKSRFFTVKFWEIFFPCGFLTEKKL